MENTRMSKNIIGCFQNLSCEFCQRADDCPEKYGEKRTYEDCNLTVHYYCVLMSSGIWQRGEDEEGFYGFLPEDIQKEINRAARLKCAICKKKGASIGCIASRCKRSYHFPCGIERGCLFQFRETFPSYCWKHRPTQKRLSNYKGSSQCTICLELVEQGPTYNILTSPCCKNAWFHRECLQRQALSAGVYFFRCPVCNNKEKFQNEMLRMGIHIPEKDASWELEQNAYQELLQRYQHCDIKRCLCKNGRDYNEPDSKWEIKRCQYCGSSGTHLACSSLTSLELNWECIECRTILAKSNGSAQKWRKRSLSMPEKADGDNLMEDPSPKYPRQSPGSHLGIHIRSPKMVCSNGFTPCSQLDLPSSNNRYLSPSAFISPSVRNLSFKKMQLGMQKREVSKILRELRLQINTKPTRLNIIRQNIWESALKGFQKRNFNPANTIEVKYMNCRNKIEVDLCCSSKEDFFQLLMLHLQNSSLFEGGHSKNLSFDSQALKDDLYYEAGKMIAISLVHGGSSPSFFSKTLFHCLVYGTENVKPTVEDVADIGVLQAIKKIKSATTLSSLESAISDCSDYLASIGCLKPVTALRDKNILVNEILNHHVIKRTLLPFESFRQGLKTLGVLEKIQMNPDAFCSILCHKPEKLSAKLLGDLFTIQCLSGADKARCLDFWMGYLQETEGGESSVTLEDILVFATGIRSIPPIGFEPDPSVMFLHIKYPIGKRDLNCLQLPITKSYENFKKVLDIAIRRALLQSRVC
ncbi:G2/M phase-specific E3 ubiquitin-protein ligase [Pantherophis guttatus]|uniref:G2/M phase-specific E3 ubiquitin-protein ligase n=1 Tax=Pantherophis guttatus TaxID=94885 RepID=A0A6P9BV62_PANGU|nr:G2/M phase-specific E3 ubiquitin-protein ligase [Pantherophis guttatus]XP_034273846.1 G2/M phase-specific E3 ubiquitin-protein ligase [Pantherophis guttatus]XP_034273847.1 G2/M phase-specific E3 ubiquitin-protein ligase [Pantherophis guttatus]XP_034273848.1 G2/M phase-specific E3 ubiquitin-protein ligase [Pantherophis guttatus]XP_034273849.1 G2/M phase-specific E3 ubiquitin-protein ligase [Pantherophis guttatus]